MMAAKPVFLTQTGFIIAVTSGSTSFLSSLLVIYIILRSSTKLASAYHRIIAFMSFWDLISSFAMALSTIPMPKEGMVYDFEGPTLGTFQTCEIQSFTILLGMTIVAASSSCLCVYYVCTICLKMHEDRFRKRIEPFLYLYAICIGILNPTILLRLQILNPTPLDAYCSIGSYPFTCLWDKDIECIRGAKSSPEISGHVFRSLLLWLLFTEGIILVSMAFIIRSVFKNELELKKVKQKKEAVTASAGTGNKSEESSVEDQHRVHITKLENTRIVTIHAIMYIAAFLLAFIFAVLAILLPENPVIDTSKIVFQPLQGFFNALIFINHKVYNLRKTKRASSNLEALRITVLSPDQTSNVHVSSITIVRKDHYFDKMQDNIRKYNLREMQMRVDEAPSHIDNSDNENDTNYADGEYENGNDNSNEEGIHPVRYQSEGETRSNEISRGGAMSAYDEFLSIETPSMEQSSTGVSYAKSQNQQPIDTKDDHTVDRGRLKSFFF